MSSRTRRSSGGTTCFYGEAPGDLMDVFDVTATPTSNEASTERSPAGTCRATRSRGRSSSRHCFYGEVPAGTCRGVLILFTLSRQFACFCEGSVLDSHNRGVDPRPTAWCVAIAGTFHPSASRVVVATRALAGSQVTRWRLDHRARCGLPLKAREVGAVDAIGLGRALSVVCRSYDASSPSEHGDGCAELLRLAAKHGVDPAFAQGVRVWLGVVHGGEREQHPQLP